MEPLIERTRIPDATTSLGDLKALRERYATGGVPQLVIYDDRGHFVLNTKYTPLTDDGWPAKVWLGLSTDLDGILLRNSGCDLRNLVALAMRLTLAKEQLVALHRSSVHEVSREVYSDSDPTDSWMVQLKDIYFSWQNLEKFYPTDEEQKAGFEKFVRDFIAVTTDPRVVTNKEMYEVLKPHFENAEDIITDYRLGKCDPRLLFVTNAVMLAFANQYPGQNIIPEGKK